MDNDVNRGKILNRERKKQIIDFSSLQFGTITPTDIDGYIEYHNKGFVFFEYKLQDAEMPKGQALALKNIVDAIQRGGREAVLFLCRHDVIDTEKDIVAGEAKVIKSYRNGNWIKQDGSKTAREMTELFIDWIDRKEVNRERISRGKAYY